MSTIFSSTFAFGPPGTVVPDRFVTSEGLTVMLPLPSVLSQEQWRTGLRVTSTVSLVPPTTMRAVEVRGFAGANAPTVRYIDAGGHLIYARAVLKTPTGVFAEKFASFEPIARVDFEYPNSEGVLFDFVGLEDGVREVPDTRYALSRSMLAVDASVCQAIVFGETSTVEVLDATALPALAEARQFIAAVAYARSGQGLAKPKYPSEDELKQPFIKRAWERCLTAAKDAVGDDVGNCTHFVIWYSDDQGSTPSKQPSEITDKWPYEQGAKISGHWGPYRIAELGGDNIYVIKYCGVK